MPAGFDPVRDVMSTPSSLGRSNSFGSNFDPVRDASPSRSAHAHHDYAVPPARYARELSRTPSADSQRSAVGAAAALPPPPAAPTQRSSRSASIADMLNSSDEPPRMHRRSSGAASASPHLVARATSHEYALHPGNANGVATRNERSPSLAHILNGGTPGAMPQRERRASQAGGGGASPSMAPAARIAELMSPGQQHHHLPSHHYQHELHPHHHPQQQQQQHRNSVSGSSPPQSYFPAPPPPPPLSHHTNILNSPPTLHATEKLRNLAAAGPSVLRSPPQMRVLSRPGSSLGVGPYDAAPPLPQPLGLPQHQRQRAASRDFAVPDIPRRSPEMRRAALPLVSPSAATAYEANYAPPPPHAYAQARERESMPSPAPSTPSSATFHPHHAGSAEYGAYPRTPLTPGGLGAPPLTPGGGERSVFAWPPAQAQGELQDRHANPAQSYAQHAPLQFQPPPSREGRNPFSATPAQAAAAALGTAPSGALATLLSRPPAHLLHPAPPSATSSAEEYEREREAAMRHEAARQRALSQAQAQAQAQGQDREREAFKRELWEREQSAAQFAAEHRALISARGGAAEEGDEEAREREREERAMWEREMERKRGGAATPVMGSAAGRKRAALEEEVEEEVKEKAQKPPAKKVAAAANGEAKEKKLTAAAKRKAAAAEAAAAAAAAQEAGGDKDAAEGEQGAEKEKEKPKARPKAKPKARAKKKEEAAKPVATAAAGGEEPTSTPTTAPGSSDAPASSAHTSPQLQQGASSPALAPPSTPQLQQAQVEKAPTPKATPKLTKRQREEAALAGIAASPVATPAKVAKKEIGASAGRNGKTAAAAASVPSAVVAETEEELKKRERRASVLQPVVTPTVPTTASEPPGAHVASVLAPAPSPSPAAPRPSPSVTRRPSVLAPPPPRPRSPTPPPQARRYAPTTRLTAPGLVKKPLSRAELEQKRALCRNPLRLAWCVEHPGRSDGWDEMFEAFGRASSAVAAGGAGMGPSAAASAAANNEAALVASHYNSRPDAGLGAREASPILPLRKFNNWIKSVLINEFAHKGGRTLDLGAGKGGDLLKWNAVGTRELVLVDIADQSIQQARARYQEKRQPFHAEFFAFDAFGSSLAEHIPAHILAPQFDNVTLQFCMHYAWERSSKALLMLENVSRYLKPGGVFIGTIPDAERLRSELRALPGDELAFGNDVYQVRFDAKQLDKKQTCPPFGHKYTFWLKDAIDECDEYVVDFAQLESLATQMGLKLIYRKTFEEVWKELGRKPDHARLARQMGVANPDQVDIPMGLSLWQAASIYLCFAFQKV